MQWGGDNWIDEVRARGVRAVGKALGLQDGQSGSLAPCPLCNADKRHTKAGDRRGAVGPRKDDAGWTCHQCDEGGDAVSLAAACATGTTKPAREKWAEVRRACANAGLCAPDAREAATFTPTRARLPAPPPRPAETSPNYPPTDEVAALWAACAAVRDDSAVAAYLATRGLDAVCVSAEMARALPSTGTLPKWAAVGSRPWRATGHRLLVPLFDVAGALRSMLARDVTGVASMKSAGATGFERRGLIMADGLGRQILAAGAPPEWWEDRALRIIITEGEMDFLSYAEQHDGEPWAPALLGFVSGSWTQKIADRIPDRSTLVIVEHDDEQGAKYTAKIQESVKARWQDGLLTIKRIRFATKDEARE